VTDRTYRFTPEKLADLVLSHDVMTMPPAQILTTAVTMTIIGGKVVYERPPTAAPSSK
jgi:predicted amidohydrolase YtcJ